MCLQNEWPGAINLPYNQIKANLSTQTYVTTKFCIPIISNCLSVVTRCKVNLLVRIC